jgi:hypothetical protein
MSRPGAAAVKVTTFIAEPPPETSLVNATGQSVERKASPSYSMIAPSSVHGGFKGKLELQSNWYV